MSKAFDLGIDLGNSKFTLSACGEGIIATEAAYLAFRGQSFERRSIVAWGDDAAALIGRMPPGISVVSPMQRGVVVNCAMASALLENMGRRVGIRRGWSKPRVIVSSLIGASKIERKAFCDSAGCLTPAAPVLVTEPMAALNSLDLDLAAPRVRMLVDVGDGATEAIVMACGDTILGESVRFGGSDIDELLMKYVCKTFAVRIAKGQARELKETLSHCDFSDDKVVIKGVSTKTFLPVHCDVAARDLFPVVDAAANLIAEFVLRTLERLPIEASGDLIEQGIYLCGGASQTRFLRQRVAHQTQLEVHPLPSPDQAVSKGLNRILDSGRRSAMR